MWWLDREVLTLIFKFMWQAVRIITYIGLVIFGFIKGLHHEYAEATYLLVLAMLPYQLYVEKD
jgi:hypothetical protein